MSGEAARAGSGQGGAGGRAPSAAVGGVGGSGRRRWRAAAAQEGGGGAWLGRVGCVAARLAFWLDWKTMRSILPEVGLKPSSGFSAVMRACLGVGVGVGVRVGARVRVGLGLGL